MKFNSKVYTYVLCILSLAIGILIGKQISSDEPPKLAKSGSCRAHHVDLTGIENPDDLDPEPHVETGALSSRESSSVRKAIETVANLHADQRAEKWAEQHAGDYEFVLRDLGVDENQMALILNQRMGLVELSSIDKVYRQRMQAERFKLLDSIKNSTTPEQFDAYLEYEKLKGADREFTKMSEKGIYFTETLDESEKAIFQNLLVDHGVLTTEVWDGPLDPLPRPLVGTERVVEHILDQLERLDTNLPGLIAGMEDAGFDVNVISDVQNYYEYQINGLDNGYRRLIDSAKMSNEEKIQQVREQVMQRYQELANQSDTSKRISEQFNSIINKTRQ